MANLGIGVIQDFSMDQLYVYNSTTLLGLVSSFGDIQLIDSISASTSLSGTISVDMITQPLLALPSDTDVEFIIQGCTNLFSASDNVSWGSNLWLTQN